MRALVVTNMCPSPARPALGSFVRDQVRALQQVEDLDGAWRWLADGGPAPPLYTPAEAPATSSRGAHSS